MKKAIGEDNCRLSRQELVFNLTNVYYRIAQLEKLLEANEVSVKQMEAHKKNVEYFLSAGTSTDVIDAQTVLLRAEMDYHQACYDKNIAIASLKRATGEGVHGEVSE